MQRCVPLALLCFCLWKAFLGLTFGQDAEEQRKRELFLRAREQIRPVPAEKPTPTSSQPKKIPTPLPAPTPRPKVLQTPKPSPTPLRPTSVPSLSQNRTTPRPTASPSPRLGPTPTGRVMPTPTISPGATPSASPMARQPSPLPSNQNLTERISPTPVQVTVGKSGLQEDEGYEPMPARTMFFGRRWRYLTPAVRQAIDRAPVRRGRWKYIIIHNSATRQGNARIFDNYHRRVRKMENGLAYHFVIGNGNGSGNGQIEIGPRWTRQINGGHVASDYLNNISIGICLVGDFDRDLPTRAQMEALRELITYLRARVGRSDGKLARVRGHREINPRPTTCPGYRFPMGVIRREFP